MSKPRELSDVEWVGLAVSREARPVLTGLHVNGRLEATDGYRIHSSEDPGGLPVGLWEPKTMRPIEGAYPNCELVTPQGESNYRVRDLEGVTAITAAAVAARKVNSYGPYQISLPSPSGPLFLEPRFVWDVLRGIDGREDDVRLYLFGPSTPVRFDFDQRQAVVMTIRVPSGRPGRFDLTEFLERT